LEDRLKWGLEAAARTVEWVAGFDFPEFEQDYEFVSLRHEEEYPFNEGRLVSSKDLDIPVKEYDFYFEEEQVPHSNALQSVIQGRGPYFAGPLARFNLNFELLRPGAREAARQAGLAPGLTNPFKSIVVRAVEILHALEEALAIMEAYEMPDAPAVKTTAREGVGYAVTEAPRGLLYHRYRLEGDGIIKDAKIVPPTSQNQKTMEWDLRQFVEKRLDLPDDKLTWQCEQLVRNYDPCISCATHFLRLEIER
jgi:coenzyme F420-reducing hydrogenase alpha subunit